MLCSFQFNPSILSPSSVLSVLLLALIHAPFEPDFSLSWALLGDSFVVGAPLPPAMGSDDEDDEVEKEPVLPEEERIAAEKLRDLSELIQAHKLREFWTVFDKLANDEKLAYLIKGLLESATNATAILRRHIATQIGITFRSVSRSTLSKFLGLERASSQLPSLRWSLLTYGSHSFGPRARRDRADHGLVRRGRDHLDPCQRLECTEACSHQGEPGDGPDVASAASSRVMCCNCDDILTEHGYRVSGVLGQSRR